METENDNQTFWRIRRAIGYLGISLPIVLVIFSLIPFFNTPVQSSISSYYYTNLREVLTGILCAVALFLIRYVGFKNRKFWLNANLLTNIAGFMALGIAFFPTNPDCWSQKIYTLVPVNMKLMGIIHYGFAAVFFSILAIISINIFTIGSKGDDKIPVSLFFENHIYKTCGWLIVLCIILIPICASLKLVFCSTLILEALALFSFGISWLIKGRALGEKGIIGRKLYREFH
jgi:hypothetical protein